MKNKIDDLRNHLFATIESLLDEDDPMELDRAKAVADVAQTIINSAKVEVDYLKATGRTELGTDLMREVEPRAPLLPRHPDRALNHQRADK